MADLGVETDPAALGKSGYLDLKLTPTGDLQVTSGVYQVRQAVTLRLLASVEDFFLDMDAGLPWHDGLLAGRQGLTPAFEAIMQNTILSTPGVLGLVSWSTELNRAARTLRVKFEAQCQQGTVAFSVPVTIGG